MHVGLESYHAGFDLAPLLKGLSDDRCQCPYWGYVIKGRMVVRYADREEVSTLAMPTTSRRATRQRRILEPRSSSSAPGSPTS